MIGQLRNCWWKIRWHWKLSNRKRSTLCSRQIILWWKIFDSYWIKITWSCCRYDRWWCQWCSSIEKSSFWFRYGHCRKLKSAKEVSEIILLYNVSSILTFMKWGRKIFYLIRKFFQFQLTVNFVTLVMVFVGGVVLRESPLNLIQMLWNNFIMEIPWSHLNWLLNQVINYFI